MQDPAPPTPSAARIEHRAILADDREGIVSRVEAGQVVARILPPLPGDRDPSSKPTVAESTAPTLELGKNLELKERNIIATARGNFRLINGLLSVEPLLELHADAANGRAPVDFSGDVFVRGGISDGFSLHAAGSLIVGGAVEASNLDVAGSLHTKGGILGKNKGECTVGGDVWCRFLSHVHITAAGDVHVQGEVTGSHIQCAGRLIVVGGPIIGGKIAANGGLECRSIGNASGAATIVEVGTDERLRSLIAVARPQIEANRKRIRGVREKIQPLMEHLKSLTPQQRERVTELLYEADELEEQTDRKCAELSVQCHAVVEKSRPQIVVSETLYPGVIIRFPGIEATIPSALRGPFQIVPRKTAAGAEIVLIEEAGSPGCLLESHHTEHLIDAFIERFAAKTAA